jgi:predicted nuclease of predicted toxin-antitoxin system
MSDEKVLQKAIDANLVILTFDKDHGELVFRYRLSNPPAVIYFRKKGQYPLFPAEILLTLGRRFNEV